ncbi:TonB-dependent receptor [Neptunicella marina]|uniref:TonB-dependent receptor n=1 Tax=Neptunicella marina TaxID=2125989 RepID=A0A8J6ITI1_9ALTE|nr:TonB-dependent receptor [Neptunicella marina]MBC3765522.1 TonB-dependent receptor [Neptunicella marina]
MQRCQIITPQKLNTSKTLLAAALSSILFSVSSAAYAQQAAEQDDTEVIMVTAQKRQQNIMKVPVVVDSVSADTLKKTNSILLSDIDKFVPGFDFSDSNMTQAGISMRGISSPNISVGGDPSSATFFDGVYMPRAAQNVLFSDIARIEVLKGPQGTLFGRNAAMGVVNIMPNAPENDDRGFVKAVLGTDNLRRYELMANKALTDTFFVRVNALVNTQDGLAENIYQAPWNSGTKEWDPGAKDHNAARISIKWLLSDDTDLQLSYDYDDLEQAPPIEIGVSQWAYGGGKDLFSGKVENDVRNGVESRDMYAYTAKLNHQFDDQLSLAYTISYRDWKTVNREDEDGTKDITRYFDTSNNEDSSIFYQELQLNYVSDKVNVVGGFSYSNEEVTQTSELNLTADSAARFVTGSLNEEIKGTIAAQIADMIQVDAFGGDADAAAQNAFGPGATFAGVVDNYYQSAGFPIDHLWDANAWAGALNALGFGDAIMGLIGMGGMPLTGDVVTATGNVTYDIVAQQMGIAEIFGPSYSGQFWEESINNTGDFTNWGVYLDADWSLNDKWNILAGLRYSRDAKDFSWYIPMTSFAKLRPGVDNILFPMTKDDKGNSAPILASDSWDKITGRLVAEYQVNNDHMLFASFSTGYKAGGYDSLVVSSAQQPFKPEDTTNFELGYKGIAFNSLRTTASIYHLQLDNRQRSISSKAPDSSTAVPTIINGDTTINGLELGLEWAVTSSLNLGLVTEYRDSDEEWEEFYNEEGTFVPSEKNSRKASNNYTLRADWIPDIGSGTTTIHVDYTFVENTNADEVGLEEYKKAVTAYFKDTQDLNARISWESSDDQFEVALWSKNLLDKRYVTGLGGLTASILGTPVATINRGREVGIDLTYHF